MKVPPARNLSNPVSVVTRGLVTWYDPANLNSYTGSGTTWRDMSGSGNAGTLVNGVGFTASNGGAMTFDGTNDMVTTTNSFSNPTAWTLCSWFRTSNTSGRKLIGLESNQTGTASGAYDRHLYVNTGGKLVFGVYIGSILRAISTTTVTTNTWFFGCGTFGSEGNIGRLYINGSSEATFDKGAGTIQVYSGWWRIGGYRLASWTGGSDGYFNGTVGACFIYNRGLAASEIMQNFQALRGRYGV